MPERDRPPIEGATKDDPGSRVEARLADVEALRSQAAADADAWRAAADRARSEVGALRRELDGVRRELDEARVELTGVKAELARLLGSRSWRITSPLRTASTRWPRAVGLGARTYRALTARPEDEVHRRRAERLAQSGLFDREFYLRRHPDVASVGIDPLEHFLQYGAAERRDPNPYFSIAHYLAQHPELALETSNPVFHYLEHGREPGNEPSPCFSGTEYLRRNPDVALAGINPLEHFLRFGRAEGRTAPRVPEAPSPETITREATLVRLRRTHRRGDVPQILIVDAQLPTPDRDSGSVRMLALVDILLELGWSVAFGSHLATPQPAYEEALRRRGVSVLRGLPAIWDHLRDTGDRYDYVVLSRPGIAEAYLAAVRARAPFARVVYDTVDLHWLRLERAASLHGSAEQRQAADEIRKREEVAVTGADLVLAISADDRAAIERTWSGVAAPVLPNVHDVRPLPDPWHERRDLLFVGNYAHPPNVDAVTWFVDEILPLVSQELPEVRFRIVGNQPPEAFRTLASPNVELVGWVEDVEPSARAARIFVSPLRYGAGMKGKIGQAMALGLPVVTTPIGAEGMLLEDGVQALVADSAPAFARAVVRLYRDEALWNSVRSAAADHVERHFSPAAVRRIVQELFTCPTARS